MDYDGIQSVLKEVYKNDDSLNLSKPERKVQFKIMYYFMKNDLESVMYELNIGTDTQKRCLHLRKDNGTADQLTMVLPVEPST